MRTRSTASFALLIAVSAAALLAIGMTRVPDVYCNLPVSCIYPLVAALPGYVAMLGMTLPVLLLARSVRHAPASRYVRAGAISCAILAFAACLAMPASAFDAMWARFGAPVGLDVPRFTRFLPSLVLVTPFYLWPVLLGAAILLTSLVLDALRPSLVVRAPGTVAGLTMMTSMTLATDREAALLFGIGLVVLWAATLASHTLLATRRMLSAA